MACSMAAAVAPCAAASSTVAGRPSLSVPCKDLSAKRSLFLLGDSSLCRVFLLASRRSSLSCLRVLHIEDSLADSLAVNQGSKGEAFVLKSHKPSWDGTTALAATEGLCIVVAAVSYTASVVQTKHTSLVASASESKFLSKIGDLSTLYVPALLAALVINAIMRALQWRSSTKTPREVWAERSIKDFTLDQRVGKLEEDVQGVAAIAQMLSRHLEKLGVRFRVTRKTLQDPIKQTAVLAQRTSEVVTALSNREDMLEKELRGTQQVLVAMQAQQAKQLELLITGLAKALNSQKASEARIMKEISSLPVRATSSSSDIGSKKKVPTAKTGEIQREKEKPVEKLNSQAQSRKSGSKLDMRVSKEDFWATATAKNVIAESPTDKHEVFGNLRRNEAGKAMQAHPQSRNSSEKVDSFFSNRKEVNVVPGNTVDPWRSDS